MQYLTKNGFMKIDTHWSLRRNGCINWKVICQICEYVNVYTYVNRYHIIFPLCRFYKNKVKKYTIIVLSYLTIINICEKCGAISYWQNDSRKKNSNNIDNIETKIYHKWVWNCHIAHASNSKIYIVRWWIKMIKCYLQCIEATYHLAMNVLIDKGISIKKI